MSKKLLVTILLIVVYTIFISALQVKSGGKSSAIIVEPPTVTNDPLPTLLPTPMSAIKTNYIKHDLHLLEKLIIIEAGSNSCSDRHQQLVAQIAINRVKSGRYKSIEEVVTTVGQYAGASYIMEWEPVIPQRVRDNALKALLGQVVCPTNVYYQDNNKHGSAVYEEFDSGYSITYFCYR